MKRFCFLLLLFFPSTYSHIVTYCIKQHSCETKDFENYSERYEIICPGSKCRSYGCIINNVIYKGSGCNGDDLGYCKHNKTAIIFENGHCGGNPRCEIRDMRYNPNDMNLFGNLSDELFCDYEPIKASYFKNSKYELGGSYNWNMFLNRLQNRQIFRQGSATWP